MSHSTDPSLLSQSQTKLNDEQKKNIQLPLNTKISPKQQEQIKKLLEIRQTQRKKVNYSSVIQLTHEEFVQENKQSTTAEQCSKEPIKAKIDQKKSPQKDPDPDPQQQNKPSNNDEKVSNNSQMKQAQVQKQTLKANQQADKQQMKVKRQPEKISNDQGVKTQTTKKIKQNQTNESSVDTKSKKQLISLNQRPVQQSRKHSNPITIVINQSNQSQQIKNQNTQRILKNMHQKQKSCRNSSNTNQIRQQREQIPIQEQQLPAAYLQQIVEEPSAHESLLFSRKKYLYTVIDKNELFRFQKQAKRLAQAGKKISQNKVHLREKSFLLTSSADLSIMIDTLTTKQYQIQQALQRKGQCTNPTEFVLNLWVFKGDIRALERQILKSFTVQRQNRMRNRQAANESQKLVSVYFENNCFQLQKLATHNFNMVHLELFGRSNFVLIVEKRAKSNQNLNDRNKNPFRPLIRAQLYKCSACNNISFYTCLCLKYGQCRPTICSCSQKIVRSHQINCKFMSSRQTSLRTPFNPLMQTKYAFFNKSRKGFVGLNNERNDCFMNTALQCLKSCKELTQYFKQKCYISHLNYTNNIGTFGETCLTYAKFICQAYCSTESTLQIDYIKRHFRRWNSQYNGQEQYDCQQFLAQFLDWLKQDLNLVKERPTYQQGLDYELPSLNLPPDLITQSQQQYWKDYLKRNNSVIEYLMAGLTRSTLQCQECLYESHSFDVFLTLPLPIPQRKLPSENQSKQGQEQVTCNVIWPNFHKTNSKINLKLRNQSYDEMQQVLRKKLNIDIRLVLIGYVKKQIVTQQIKSSIQGSQYIREILRYDKKSQQSPPYKFYFLLYTKQQIEESEFSVQFVVQHVSKESSNIFAVSTPRLLFFKRKTDATLKSFCKKVLSYIYSMIFTKKALFNNSEIQYIEHYSSRAQLPFNLYVKKNNGQYQEILKENDSYEDKMLDESDVFIRFGQAKNTQHFQLIKMKMFMNQSGKAQGQQTPNRQCLPTNGSSSQSQKKKGNRQISIYDCLEYFRRPDYLHVQDSWICPKCDTIRPAKKTMSIFQGPKVLIVFFKRFQSIQVENLDGVSIHQSKKIDTYIKYPQILDLQSHVENQCIPYTGKPKPLKYRLFSTSNHFYFKSSAYDDEIGHYTAAINQDGTWWMINDNTIFPMDSEQICSRYAYILFYERIQETPFK